VPSHSHVLLHVMEVPSDAVCIPAVSVHPYALSVAIAVAVTSGCPGAAKG
jgi:hypothetical protein